MKQALLVIDVQKVYTTPGSALYCQGHEAVIDRINALVARAEVQGDLIVHVRHIHRADGSDAGRMFDFHGEPGELGFVAGTTEAEDDPALRIGPGALQVTKQRYSCFVGTGLDEALRAQGIQRLVITGFMTNFCCETTARHGHDLDYFVDMVLDATGCPDLSQTVTQSVIKEVVAASLGAGYARVITTAEALA